jgi:hypothetical protein
MIDYLSQKAETAKAPSDPWSAANKEGSNREEKQS